MVPLSADFTQANIYDNQIYSAITSSSLPHGVQLRGQLADSGYDDHKLYNLSIDRRGFGASVSCIRNIQSYLS